MAVIGDVKHIAVFKPGISSVYVACFSILSQHGLEKQHKCIDIVIYYLTFLQTVIDEFCKSHILWRYNWFLRLFWRKTIVNDADEKPVKSSYVDFDISTTNLARNVYSVCDLVVMLSKAIIVDL